MTSEELTAGGARVTRHTEEFDPADLPAIVAAVEHGRGGVLSSGMEYPGRYSRWNLAYLHPSVEVVARGRTLTVRSLNARGLVLLPLLRRAILPCGETVADEPGLVTVHVPGSDAVVSEEQRTRRPSVFTALRAMMAAMAGTDPHLGFYGAFGYDLSFQFEPIRTVLDRAPGDRDLVLHLADEIYVVDRKRERAHVHRYEFEVDGESTAGLAREAEPTPYSPAAVVPPPPTPGAYAEIVEKARERFYQGDLFEVTPSHTMHAACDSPGAFYERLTAANPAPYEFFFNLGDGEYLVGASPEMYVRVSGPPGRRRVETCPIAGTIRRGADPLEDAVRIAELIGSAKEESELTMCTDVDRNDKSRVCVPGSVQVIGRRQIELYSRLIHTVDHVEGTLRPEFDALDAFLTHTWAVTVTGAPKTWAMQFIEEHEATPRRWYGGAVGYLGFDGTANTGLTLRTAQIRDGLATVRAGATLLYDSDPASEERETHLKARALLESVGTPPAPAAPAAVTEPVGAGRRILLVDHQDSFVNTLADYFRQYGADVTTLRFGFPPSMLDTDRPDLVVLSPGPGRPKDFDCAGLLSELDGRGLPAFGVCLGLQAMIEHGGGTLALLPEPVHGKPGVVKVLGGRMLAGLPDEFTAARYHSLHAKADQVRGGFTATAMTDDVVMAIEDHERRRYGVQFHPESILTATGRAGHTIVANVLGLVGERAG
ncbi:anthranilate synthase component I [Phytomonospora endophytica]|uniref:Anthranilate synthase n=1 Tax=Phytomonospora endophytica TaxID=714109 RepID=A0A841F794_9ACTN|nr:anthranilate synthase component I [Phytomonospora endophytica]MBB6032881.1 anthranilate synthase [Phytomonospora endophytica]